MKVRIGVLNNSQIEEITISNIEISLRWIERISKEILSGVNWTIKTLKDSKLISENKSFNHHEETHFYSISDTKLTISEISLNILLVVPKKEMLVAQK